MNFFQKVGTIECCPTDALSLTLSQSFDVVILDWRPDSIDRLYSLACQFGIS